LQNQRVGRRNRSCLRGFIPIEVGSKWGKCIRGQILCIPEYLFKLFFEWRDRQIKENGGGDEFKYDIFDIV
jgi:hypothetical protein